MNSLNKLICFSLQYGSVEIGYKIDNQQYDLTREESDEFCFWAKHPQDQDLMNGFRNMLVSSGNHPQINVDSDMLTLFEKYFLFASHTVLMDDDEIKSSIDHFKRAMESVASFEEEYLILKRLRALISVAVVGDNDALQLAMIALLDGDASHQFVFPIFSDGHASYGVCEKR